MKRREARQPNPVIFAKGNFAVKECHDKGEIYYTVLNRKKFTQNKVSGMYNNAHRHYHDKTKAICVCKHAYNGTVPPHYSASMRADIEYLIRGGPDT